MSVEDTDTGRISKLSAEDAVEDGDGDKDE